ncbi:hypothetical protein EYC59_06515 [Candidatus Saccharibacteria bacterium]|nr:MAG: hypothetical protein EYC59_06515 [Candidatus Saccharibacteria bacterium]
MSELEQHTFIVCGELPKEGWHAAKYVLESMGLCVTPADKLGEYYTAPATKIPYDLAGIQTEDTFVSIEHADEFWPLFLHQKEKGEAGIEQHQAQLAFHFLTEPTHRNGTMGMSASATRGYAASLGLTVQTRSEAGFPASSESDTVVTAASLIHVIRGITELKPNQRPKWISQKNLPFLNAFANHLEKQIENQRPTVPS